MRQTVWITVALIVTFLAGLSPSLVQAANDDRDIPGVALPASRITSEVGGAVFDRVWSIDLAEGKVALLRLTGESGAELGLYLFNSYAQSVYTSEPIATSARPGGTQEIAIALPAGRYFVNVNGRNADRTYRFTLTTALYADMTPPTIAARFVSGNNRFSTPIVNIDPRAYDALSGVSHIRYGVDDNDWTGWLPYSGGTIAVPVPPVEGEYLIRVQARNGVELLSDVANLTATIDLTSPNFQVIGDLSREVTYSNRPRLIYLFNEPMAVSSFTDAVFLRDISGAPLPTTCSYDNSVFTVSCVPNKELTYGRAYLVDFQGASDVAGNSAIDTSPLTLSVQRRTSISLATTSTSIRFGETIDLRVTTQGLPTGTKLTLESRPSTENAWVTDGLIRVNRIGEASALVSPMRSREYRVRYNGDLERAPSESKTLLISVVPDLQIASPRANAIVRTPGVELVLKGVVAPSQAGVRLIVFKCKVGYVSCALERNLTVTPSSTGLISTVWTTGRGFWKIRLVTTTVDGFLRATSRTIRIEVR